MDRQPEEVEREDFRQPCPECGELFDKADSESNKYCQVCVEDFHRQYVEDGLFDKGGESG